MEKKINKIFTTILFLVSQSRVVFWRTLLKKCGHRVNIMSGVVIMSPQNVEIGNDVLLNIDVKIGGQLGVTIGNYVQIGYNVNIISEDHSYNNPALPIIKQGYRGGAINIEDDAWIGANAVIMPSLTIGKGAIVGANAVVTKDVLPYSIVAGVPAKFIKYRFSKNIINKLTHSKTTRGPLDNQQ